MFPDFRLYNTDAVIKQYGSGTKTDTHGSMDQDRTYSSASSKTRQFSGSMVLFVFVHTLFAVIDRVIYLRQNRNNLEFEYIFYNKLTGTKLSNEETRPWRRSSPSKS